MPKLLISGVLLVFLAFVSVNYCNYAMRSGLTTLSTPVESPEIPPPPAEIATAMVQFSNLGFLASALGFLGLILIVFQYQKAPKR